MPTKQRLTGDWTLKQLLALGRDDLTAAVRRIAALTDLAPQAVRDRLKVKQGGLRVCDAFREWPTRLAQVPPITCARASDLGVIPDLAVAANLSAAQARTALKSAASGRRASTVLEEVVDAQARAAAAARAKAASPSRAPAAQPPSTRQKSTRQPTTQNVRTAARPAESPSSTRLPKTVAASTRQAATATLKRPTTTQGATVAPARATPVPAERAAGAVVAGRFLLE